MRCADSAQFSFIPYIFLIWLQNYHIFMELPTFSLKTCVKQLNYHKSLVLEGGRVSHINKYVYLCSPIIEERLRILVD